jgi:fumarylacetoacetate (FAA) hydrolase
VKLLTYRHNDRDQVGLYHDGRVLSVRAVAALMGYWFPETMREFLEQQGTFERVAQTIDQQFKDGKFIELALPFENLVVHAPLPNPPSIRDAYAFREHVETARANRGLEMSPVFDQFPVFYFTNPHSVTGPGPVEVMGDHLDELDYELEVAVVIGQTGRNIAAKDADRYIFGYMVMNDWSARRLQREEMQLNLGPAKGKDFATSFGPFLVTPDELRGAQTQPQPGHTGRAHSLEMIARVNGQELSRGNLSTMHWTFAEIIERASYGTTLHPGDIIGSGTVGKGCLLELNGTARRHDSNAPQQWLGPFDNVELEIEGLGTLRNTVLEVSEQRLPLKT